MKTSIYSLSYGGDGVGKVDGKVCFVSGAIPGEEVSFDVKKETDSFVQGSIKEIIVPSADRAKPVCQYYARCGGCDLQHISYEKEVFYKKDQVKQLIRRIGGLKDFDKGEIVASNRDYNYRSSVTFNRSGNFFGYFERDGKTIFEVDSCPIAEECINKEIQELFVEAKIDAVTLKSDWNGKVWVSDRPGERFFVDRYRGVDMYVSTKCFSQNNRYIAEKIAETIETWVGEDFKDAALFDAYCGIGFFGFLLMDKFNCVFGMDSAGVSIDCAKSTAKTGKYDHVKTYKGDVEKEFLDLYGTHKKDRNVVLLDPPRKGIGREFLESLKRTDGVEKIFYVSCDPANLARDIKTLVDGGTWDIGRIMYFDMFPRTKHIETLVEFVKV